jgi:hypothetical protein
MADDNKVQKEHDDKATAKAEKEKAKIEAKGTGSDGGKNADGKKKSHKHKAAVIIPVLAVLLLTGCTAGIVTPIIIGKIKDGETQKPTLAAPIGVHVHGTMLMWDAVENATDYKVKITAADFMGETIDVETDKPEIIEST